MGWSTDHRTTYGLTSINLVGWTTYWALLCVGVNLKGRKFNLQKHNSTWPNGSQVQVSQPNGLKYRFQDNLWVDHYQPNGLKELQSLWFGGVILLGWSLFFCWHLWHLWHLKIWSWHFKKIISNVKCNFWHFSFYNKHFTHLQKILVFPSDSIFNTIWNVINVINDISNLGPNDKNDIWPKLKKRLWPPTTEGPIRDRPFKHLLCSISLKEKSWIMTSHPNHPPDESPAFAARNAYISISLLTSTKNWRSL